MEATRNKKSIKKEFVPSSTLQKFPIDLETSHRFEPISFKFVALQDNTVYTVMVGLADNHSGNNSPKELMITPGFPKYFYSEADVVSCINGHIRNGSEKIFLSTNWQEKNLLNDLVITAKL